MALIIIHGGGVAVAPKNYTIINISTRANSRGMQAVSLLDAPLTTGGGGGGGGSIAALSVPPAMCDFFDVSIASASTYLASSSRSLLSRTTRLNQLTGKNGRKTHDGRYVGDGVIN